MEKLLVSGCLLGHPCRYDGKAKRNEAVCALREKWELISVCPETMGGLKAPREPAEQRMVDGRRRVISRDGRDLTAFLKRARKGCWIWLWRRAQICRFKGKQPLLRVRLHLRRHLYRPENSRNGDSGRLADESRDHRGGRNRSGKAAGWGRSRP